ncbi:MAG: hypothetical protein M1488_04345 [Gammaproteobacteria bacterium]|jgi:hypothetical protein|nr:hypothetical protein [Gammaproteobacteria bacterium]
MDTSDFLQETFNPQRRTDPVALLEQHLDGICNGFSHFAIIPWWAQRSPRFQCKPKK